MPPDWPTGSRFVLLNGVPEQIDLASSARGLSRHYRVGPAARGYDDPSFVHQQHAFQGVGLRPYSPCHLRISGGLAEDIDISWIRRTRIDGDSWQSVEVPLGEVSESYLLRIMGGVSVLREVMLTSPHWTYSAADQASDAVTVPFQIAVAQVSDSFGPGLFETIEVT
jgi:hypothetical protein